MKRELAAIVVMLAMLATACGNDAPVAVSESPSTSKTPRPSPSGDPEESPGEAETRGRMSFEVWFNEGERLSVAYRTVPTTPAVGRAAMEELLEGPSPGEIAAGMGTQAPPGTRLRGLTVTNGIASVDLSRDFESGGGSLSMSMRLAQLVYTLTQFPTVDGVAVEIDGERVTAFGGEGIDTSDPLTRSDFSDYAPPIVVTFPRPGGEVAPGSFLRGDADVFEATVSLRIVGDGGKELLETFTTATCGTGCRGTFEKKLKFELDRPQDGVIQVYSASAEDGSPQHVVEVPVRLVP